MVSGRFLAAGALLTALYYTAWWHAPLLETIDRRLYDSVSSLRKEPSAPASTVIVTIDEASLARYGQWPWPRTLTAQLLETVARGHPAAIALDMLFPEPDRTSPSQLHAFYRMFYHLETAVTGLPRGLTDNDARLADAIRTSRAILPVAFDTRPTRPCTLPPGSTLPTAVVLTHPYRSPYLLCSLPDLQSAAAGTGHIHASPDPDGIMRRLPLLIASPQGLVPALGLAAIGSVDPDIRFEAQPFRDTLRVHVAGHTLTCDSQTDVLLRFYPPSRYPTVSARDILEGHYDLRRLQGKFVFVSATATGLHDRITVSDRTIRPGIYVHATLVENIFNDDLTIRPALWKEGAFVLSFVAALLFVLLAWRTRYHHMVLLLVATALAVPAATVAAMQTHLYLSAGYFIVPLGLHLFILAVILLLLDYRDKKRFFREIELARNLNRELGDQIALTREQILRQDAMMFQQSKLASMGEMIGNIAHQWRQPLNTLGLLIQNVEDAYEFGELDRRTVGAFSKKAMEQIDYMSKTIDDFRHFVHPRQLALTFTVGKAVDETVMLVKSAFEHHAIVIAVCNDAPGARATGLPSEFKQILVNLLSNAKDAILFGASADRNVTIRITADPGGRTVRIDVADRAGGVPPSLLDRIFEPYFTTKEEPRGTGIGLYMSHLIAEKMGGSVTVANADGGAVFTVILPLAEENAPNNPAVSSSDLCHNNAHHNRKDASR